MSKSDPSKKGQQVTTNLTPQAPPHEGGLVRASSSIYILDYSDKCTETGTNETTIKVISSRQEYSFPVDKLGDGKIIPITTPTPSGDPPDSKSETGTEIDVQEVGCETLDLPDDPVEIVMNFSAYGSDIEVFKTHIGLRRKIQPLGASTSSPTITDDYNREIVRYLKKQINLHRLVLILEIPLDDDKYELKTWGGGQNPPEVGKIKQSHQHLLPNPKIPTSVYHIHVEMPGISSENLPQWKYFLEVQTSIQTLICNFGVILWDFYAPTVLKNSGTLQKVVLRRLQSYNPETRKHVPFDWAIFSEIRKLAYLKVTCGFKDRWTEWRSYSRPLPNETLVHKNFSTLPKENLAEFHFGKFVISEEKLNNLVENCERLQVLCVRCPDREYYDGDWALPSVVRRDDFFGIGPGGDANYSSYMREMAPSENTARRDKNALISLLIILFGIGFTCIIVLICVAVYFSHPNSD